MRNKWVIIIGTGILAVALATAALAASPIKLVINGRGVRPDVPPQLVNGRTMVPVRWVAEALGAQVEWDEEKNQVTVTNTGGETAGSDTTPTVASPTLPAEVWQAMEDRFPQEPSAIRRQAQSLWANLDGGARELAVWLNLDRVNGALILFQQDEKGIFQPAYEIDEPVYNVYFEESPQFLVVATGTGGTGMQENWFHMIRSVGGQFKEVWAGLERSMQFALPPYAKRLGSIQFDGEVLRHFVYQEELNGDEQVLSSGLSTVTYRWDRAAGRFVPEEGQPGVSRYLLLNRPEIRAGESVQVRAVELSPAVLETATLVLQDTGGRVVDEQDMSTTGVAWLSTPPVAAPGEYVIELRNQEGYVLAQVGLNVLPPTEALPSPAM